MDKNINEVNAINTTNSQEGTQVHIESPCLECRWMMQCKGMCRRRLEWALFDAESDDEELHIYGNNLPVSPLDQLLKNRETPKKVDENKKSYESMYEKVSKMTCAQFVAYYSRYANM